MQEGLEERVARVVEAVRPRLRGVIHEVTFAISLVTGTALISNADGARAITAAAIYATSVSLLFGTSALYHRRSWPPRAHGVLSRLDHSMIFVLIAGTYTPFALLLLRGLTQWVVFGVVWAGAVMGIVLELFVHRGRWLSTALYLALGWTALAVLPQLARAGGPAVFTLLVLGGVLYSVGAVVYARRRPDPAPGWFGFHEVFHALTLLAFAAHYVAVSVTTYRYAGT